MYKMEQYASVLAHNMLQLFTQPFDAINDNIGEIFSHLLNEGNIFVTKHQLIMSGYHADTPITIKAEPSIWPTAAFINIHEHPI